MGRYSFTELLMLQNGGSGGLLTILLPVLIIAAIIWAFVTFMKRKTGVTARGTSKSSGNEERDSDEKPIKMKLTLNRTEEQKAGIFKTSTVYHLDVNLEVTPEEMALIKKHKWDDMPFCEGMFLANRVIEFRVGYVVGKAQRFSFKSVNELAHVERQVIENAKKLKQQLEAAVGFTSGGPREVEL